MEAREARGSPAASPQPLPLPAREDKTARGPREKRKIAVWAARVPATRKSRAAHRPPNPEKADLSAFLLALGESPHFTEQIFRGKRFDDVAAGTLLFIPGTVTGSRF